jgi:hypothetical protein
VTNLRRRATASLIGLLAVLVSGTAASAGTLDDHYPPPPYRTDAQAQHYVAHGLKRWAGIDLTKQPYRSAYCINGENSRIEVRAYNARIKQGLRPKNRFAQDKTNRYGENIYASFACTLNVQGRSFNLYVRTRWGSPAWIVQADR